MDKRLEVWCDQVISEVRCWMDHNQIRSELEAHMEDRCAALEELNYPPELAAERTLAAMGDPVAVGQALDKEHSLWLGWLWILSIVAVLFSWMWLVSDINYHWSHYINRLKETVEPTAYENAHLDENAVFPEDFRYVCAGVNGPVTVDAGDYTLEIEKAVWWRVYDKWTDVYVLMSVTPKHFWYGAEIRFLDNVQATDSTGAAILNINVNNLKYYGIDRNRPHMRASDHVSNNGSKPFGSRRVLVTINLKKYEDPEWVELFYPYGEHSWRVRLEREAAG